MITELILDTHILLWALEDDPIDRALISQVETEKIFLLTSDDVLKHYDEACILIV